MLGKVYADEGVEQGRAVLRDLARHPATAKHVATKLARHFVADEPPPALVERLARTFRDTDGDLKEVARALVDGAGGVGRAAHQAQAPGRMGDGDGARDRRTPPMPRRFTGGQALLGEPLWRPPSPKGFPTTRRPGSTASASGSTSPTTSPSASPTGRPAGDPGDMRWARSRRAETRQAVARAESRQQALALLFMSPEFQRR